MISVGGQTQQENTYVVKFPAKSMAPPTKVRAGKAMVVRSVLLAISLAPAMEVRAGKVRFLTPGLPTKVKLPSPILLFPMLVRLGATSEVKVFSSKVRVPLTTARDGMLTLEALRKVALLAHSRFGSSMLRSSPLEAKLMSVPTLPTWVEIRVRRRLLLMSMRSTVSRLMPVREVRPVFSMVTLEAWEIESGKVSPPRPGSAFHRMVLAEVSLSKDRVESLVRLNKSKEPPMDSMLLEVRLTRLPALWETRSPWISLGPLISMTPAASGLRWIDPLTLVHWAYAPASAALVMVAVGWLQRVGWESWGAARRHRSVSIVSSLWGVRFSRKPVYSESLELHLPATTAPARARAGTRSFWANMVTERMEIMERDLGGGQHTR